MKINTDINILGGLPDWNLVKVFLQDSTVSDSIVAEESHYGYTNIKTNKAVSRFKRAITETLIRFNSPKSEKLIKTFIQEEGISPDCMLLLFWNASYNNDLLNYLNENVLFPALYGGRVSLSATEATACLKDMGNSEIDDWTPYTIGKVGSKYLTLLKKFGIMQGGYSKSLVNIHLSDKLFILFIYWLKAIETKSNLLQSPWIKYSFSEKQYFIERLLQKKYTRYIDLYYTGDILRIETLFDYNSIYHELTSS